jgi:hypothetical protein
MLDRIVDETDEDLRAYELSRIHDYLAMKFNRETGKLASEELKGL